ncbi:uncharacterized protein AMSG_10825 [Thecamonas trahens ATCC 50062]|uniref:PPM-type phosphatase domain-containing protein n=1 Tax=Thecamonas trahens ATCC 50062 TaxID=461836 RepID=A0A0L0DUP1_THETB|nr:hypothetical protein AMSG_10825 [Thecamonas trahens ATCC 50062]KNC55203.1 hypothetical protein AMSG_10825 [Thecamonas trahens ATCC 50062]|eukprot:XP_013753136.1 hypothetical protein AMSG_10825 [Thecamonas trahens ATCC 50062]
MVLCGSSKRNASDPPRASTRTPAVPRRPQPTREPAAVGSGDVAWFAAEDAEYDRPLVVLPLAAASDGGGGGGGGSSAAAASDSDEALRCLAMVGVVCGHGGPGAAAAVLELLPAAVAATTAAEPCGTPEYWAVTAATEVDNAMQADHSLAYEGASAAWAVIEAEETFVISGVNGDDDDEWDASVHVPEFTTSVVLGSSRMGDSLANFADAALMVHVHVAWVGGPALRMTRVSTPHVVSNGAERERVISSGGVIVADKVQGVLEVTRSFGDAGVAGKLVHAKPDVVSLRVEPDMLWLLMVSPQLDAVLSTPSVARELQTLIGAMSSANDVAASIGEWACSHGAPSSSLVVLNLGGLAA